MTRKEGSPIEQSLYKVLLFGCGVIMVRVSVMLRIEEEPTFVEQVNEREESRLGRRW